MNVHDYKAHWFVREIANQLKNKADWAFTGITSPDGVQVHVNTSKGPVKLLHFANFSGWFKTLSVDEQKFIYKNCRPLGWDGPNTQQYKDYIARRSYFTRSISNVDEALRNRCAYIGGVQIPVTFTSSSARKLKLRRKSFDRQISLLDNSLDLAKDE